MIDCGLGWTGSPGRSTATTPPSTPPFAPHHSRWSMVGRRRPSCCNIPKIHLNILQNYSEAQFQNSIDLTSFDLIILSLSNLTPSFSPCTVRTHLHPYRALERIQCHSQTHCARPPRTRARTLSKSRRPRSPHPMHLHCCAHLPTSSLAHAPSWPQQRAHSRAVARLGSLLRCRAAHCRRPASPPR